MLDEPSLGLAPLLVEQIFSVIQTLHRRDLPILLIEQNAALSLKVSHRAYVLERGRDHPFGHERGSPAKP